MPRTLSSPGRRRTPGRRTVSGRLRPARPRTAPAPFLRPGAAPLEVREVCSAPAVLVAEDAPLLDAAMLMRTHGVSGLPVVDRRGRVVGVISQRDLSRLLVGSAGFPGIQGLLDVVIVGLASPAGPAVPKIRARLEKTRVRSAMSRPPIVTRPDESLPGAAATMHAHRINRLPVVDRGRLVGVVTRGDLFRAVIAGAGPTVRPYPGRSAGRPGSPSKTPRSGNASFAAARARAE